MTTAKVGTLIIVGVVASVIAYAVFLVYITWPVSELSIAKAGVFGDSFGILTSMFSGLAFCGVIITILLQREELRYQREELRLQREEVAANREVLIAQQEELARQVAETALLARNAERQAAASEQLAMLTKSAQERALIMARLEASPVFVRGGGSSSQDTYNVSVTNEGSDISAIELEHHLDFDVLFDPPPLWKSGATHGLTLRGNVQCPFEFRFVYTTSLDERGSAILKFKDYHDFEATDYITLDSTEVPTSE